MCIRKLKLLFRKEDLKPTCRPVPSDDELAQIMRGKDLYFSDEVVKVLESPDLFRRIVILKREDGLYRAVFENLFPFDEDELMFFGPDDPPGFWSDACMGVSLYDSLETALKEVGANPEYREFIS